MKKSRFVLGMFILASIMAMSSCSSGNNFDVGSVAEDIGNKLTGYVENIKSYTVSQINSEVEKFMEEKGISKDKVKEVEDLVKEWSEIAINAKGEIDKSKISLKDYLSERLS